jgi:tetratricopeptide (TPR) repeat protein
MSKCVGYLLCVCAVGMFKISIPLYAAETAIPQQVLDWQNEAQNGIVKNDVAGAVEVYQKIQKAYPDTEYAADAQKQVVLTYLQSNQSDKAFISLAEFSKIYSSPPGYTYQMGEIINRLADAKLALQAKEACQSLLKRFGDNPEMLGVLQRKARCEVMMNEPDMADETVKIMQQKYATHPQYVYAMNWAAFEYRMRGFHTRAVGLYNYLLTLDLPADIQFRCRAGLVLSEMKLGDTAAAVKEAQQVKTAIRDCQNYDQVGELDEVINTLADAGQLGTSRELCQAVFEQFPDNPQTLGLLQRKAQYEVMMKKPDLVDESVRIMQQQYNTNPGISNILASTAFTYCSQGFYPQAKKLYQDVLNSKPAGDIELRCKAGIVLAYLKQNDKENALQAARQVKAAVLACQNYDQMVELEEIINPLVDAGYPAVSREICQAVVEQFPGNPRLLGLLQRKARCEVMMKEPNLAEATIQVMQQYSADSQYPSALSWAAYEYLQTGYYPQALELAQHVLDMKPSSQGQLQALSILARVYIRLGKEAEVQEKVEYLLSNFKDDPNDQAKYLFEIGEEYYYLAHTNPLTCSKLTENGGVSLQKAVKVWQALLDCSLKTETIADAWYFSGVSYWKIGDIEQATWCYTILTKDWPGYKYNWSAQPYIGLGYEILRDQGYFTHEEIDSWIEESYQKTVNDYPDGCMVEEAKSGLDRLHKSKLSGQSVSAH